jgi:hypothetical protein
VLRVVRVEELRGDVAALELLALQLDGGPAILALPPVGELLQLDRARVIIVEDLQRELQLSVGQCVTEIETETREFFGGDSAALVGVKLRPNDDST